MIELKTLDKTFQMIHASDYKTGVIISSVAAGMNNNFIFVRY